jgi:hypothetical protein
MWVTAASGGPLLFDQYAPSAILKPKTEKPGPIYAPPSGGHTKKPGPVIYPLSIKH